MKIDSTLTGNLQELYGLELAKKSSYHQVVPGLWGNRIYYSEVGWGKILKIVYAVWTFFFGSRSVIEKLRKAIRYTERAFERQFKNLEKHFSSYQSSLVLLLEEDCYFDPKIYAKERWIFTRWHDSSAPFIRMVVRGESPKIDRLFKRLIGKSASGSTSKFKQIPNYEEIQSYQKIINVVRQIPEKPPLAALKKLAWKKQLFQEEEKAMKVWIGSIHSLGNKMKVTTFHKGMKSLVKHVERMHRTQYVRKPRVDDLELELAKYGLNIFRQKDPKYMKWCESLKAGDELNIRGKKYPIEDELTSCKMENKLRVYTVKNNPNKVIVVGQNRVILSIKKRGAQEFSWGIRPVHWFEVSSDGRFAIVEKLKIAVSKRRWLSNESIHLDDLLLLKPIADQVSWFIEQNAVPKNLDSSNLMYSQMNSLKSTKILMKGEFNYPKLVDFCKKCANGNLTVYKYLMSETGLSNHSYQKYFQEVIKRTLEGKDDLAEDIGALQQFQITDYPVIEKGKLFKKLVVKLQKKCMRKLLDKYTIKNPLSVAKEVAKQIYKEYVQGKYVCSLWPKMNKRVVAATVKNLGLSRKLQDSD